jgi:hypothetical protein
VEEEVLIGLVQLADVVFARAGQIALGVVLGPAAQALDQHLGRGLEVDDEVRRRHVAGQQVEEALIDEQFVVVQVQVREDLVLVEQVVADRGLQEQVGLPQARQLAMPVQQVEQLRLKRGAGAFGVEVGEKRVVGVFEDGRGIEARREPFGQYGFADPDGAFNSQIMKGHAGRVYCRFVATLLETR